MKVLDLNLLLYAINRDSPQHAKAKAWPESTLSGEETVAIPWVVTLGFLRIATNRLIFPRPIPIDDAIGIVDGWFAQEPVIALTAGEEHWAILKDLLANTGAAGNLATDAHLAAIALENGAEVCSIDSDFARLPQLHWVSPLA